MDNEAASRFGKSSTKSVYSRRSSHAPDLSIGLGGSKMTALPSIEQYKIFPTNTAVAQQRVPMREYSNQQSSQVQLAAAIS